MNFLDVILWRGDDMDEFFEGVLFFDNTNKKELFF